MGKSTLLQASFPHNAPLLDAMNLEAAYPVLNAVTPMRVRRGERFISQGDEGDKLYIIQDGTCAVSVEKDQKNYG